MQSNAYTLIFTSITTIILGFLLSFVSISLKDTQQINEDIDIMKNILYSLEFSEKDKPWTGEEVKILFVNSKETASSKSLAVSPSIVKVVQSVRSRLFFKSVSLIFSIIFLK